MSARTEITNLPVHNQDPKEAGDFAHRSVSHCKSEVSGDLELGHCEVTEADMEVLRRYRGFCVKSTIHRTRCSQHTFDGT